MAVRQPEIVVGFTHASSVMLCVRCSEAASATVTQALEPLNVSPLPFLPAAQAAPESVPLLPSPEVSAVVVPDPSLKAYAATSPVGAVPLDTVMPTLAPGFSRL